MIIEEVRVDILLITSLLRTTLIIVQQAENIRQHENVEQHNHNVKLQNEAIQNEPIIEELQEIVILWFIYKNRILT